MSGNTRGKLKEHFEGIHRNLDWCVQHVNKSLLLIREQLMFTEGFVSCGGDVDKEEAFLMTNPFYRAIHGIGKGIQTFDELAGKIYGDL